MLLMISRTTVKTNFGWWHRMSVFLNQDDLCRFQSRRPRLFPDRTNSLTELDDIDFHSRLRMNKRCFCRIELELRHATESHGGLLSSLLFSSLLGRQLLNCLALRPPIGPNALPLINQKPNDKGKGLYPP